jgi:hypothetical protein
MHIIPFVLLGLCVVVHLPMMINPWIEEKKLNDFVKIKFHSNEDIK